MKKAILIAAAVVATCVPCIEWTRFTGDVKKVDLAHSTVTIALRKSGDLVTIPKDYQVTIYEKHGETRELKTLQLDDTITLLRVPADKPQEDTEGLAPPQH